MSLFGRARRALLICIGLRLWSPQWANRGGVFEKTRDFGVLGEMEA